MMGHPNLEHLHRSCTNSYRRQLSSTKELLRNFHLCACNTEIASRFLGKWHRARFCDCQDAHRGPSRPNPNLDRMHAIGDHAEIFWGSGTTLAFVTARVHIGAPGD